MDPRILRAMADDWPAPFVYRTVSAPTPAAGTNWTFTVPGESVWGLVAITAKLVTSAVVANRAAVLNVSDGTTVLYQIAPGAVQAASLTTTYSWLPELATFDNTITGGALNVAMPPTYLASGQVLSSATALIDVGDQWSAVSLTVIEVYHGHREHERILAEAIENESDALARILTGSV